MANVAGVTQLMETVAPTTQAVASTAAPEQSFATAMQQANSDAGVPATPVEQQVAADAQDAGKVGGKNGEQTSAQASGQPVQPSATSTSKAAPSAATPTSSLRYTPANMLSAMLGGTGTTVALDQGNAAQKASSASAVLVQTIGTGSPSPVVLPVAPASKSPVLLPDAAIPVQVAANDIRPADVAPLVLSPSAVVGTPTKTNARTETSSAHVSGHSAAKQDAALTNAEAIAAPVLPLVALQTSSPLTLAAPALMTTPTADTNAASIASAVLAAMASSHKNLDTLAIQAGTSVAASTVAGPAPNSPTQVAAPSTNKDEQPEASSFGQSLAAQFGTTGAALASRAAAFLPVEHPLATPLGEQPLTPLTQPNLSATTQVSAATPALSLPVPVADTTAAAIPPLASPVTAQVPAPLGQNPIHKASARPALSVDALQPPSSAAQTSSAIQPATVQPTASASSADGKATPHLAVPAISAPAFAAVSDASTVVVTNLGGVHTPVAITALSNPSGPSLVNQTASAVTSSSTSDPLQHTTLTSTPTTLEVGVASGTHGWLKIRAELNASGTVDASLTGASATATGRLHNDLPALSSFLQEERVAVGSLNISAPNATTFALHSVVASTLEPASSFTRSAAAEVGATGAAVAGDAGASGGRAPQQQAPDSSAPSSLLREDDAVAASVTSLSPLHYGGVDEFTGGDELSRSGYTGGGSWLNVRV